MKNIVCGIQRHLREECGFVDVDLLNDKATRFSYFRRSLDAHMKQLTADGIGLQVNSKDTVTPTDEKTLWETGVLDTNTSVGLLNAVFFYNTKAFASRAVDEHRNLDASEFQFGFDSFTKKRYLQFSGRRIKNLQGGLKQNLKKIPSKKVMHYANEALGDRCLVKMYELYLSLIPSVGPFYRKPLDPLPGTKGPRYSPSQVVGINT